MRRHISIAALTILAASAVAVAAPAQERRTDSVRVRTRSPERTFVYSFGPEDMMVMRRGRLGITVDLRPDAARDTVGALVSGVTPGGPADRAGVRASDIITRLNGTRLAVTDGSNEERDQSRPGLRLINLASRLEQGDTVRLDVQREGRPVTLTFTAAETDMDQIVERMRRLPGGQTFLREFSEGPGFPRMAPGEMPRIRVMTSLDGLGDLELIRVTPELAQALSLSEGVLVADAGSDSSLGLRTGDVITSIGGRRPTSPSHAMRILSSYESGEAVPFEVMRRGRRASVTGRMPASREPTWRVRPNRFDHLEPGMDAPFRFKVTAEGQV